jgi:hypothetical protein
MVAQVKAVGGENGSLAWRPQTTSLDDPKQESAVRRILVRAVGMASVVSAVLGRSTGSRRPSVQKPLRRAVQEDVVGIPEENGAHD